MALPVFYKLTSGWQKTFKWCLYQLSDKFSDKKLLGLPIACDMGRPIVFLLIIFIIIIILPLLVWKKYATYFIQTWYGISVNTEVVAFHPVKP